MRVPEARQVATCFKKHDFCVEQNALQATRSRYRTESACLIYWYNSMFFVWHEINHFEPPLLWTLTSLITNLFTGMHISVLEVILPEIPTCLNCDLVNFKYSVFIFKVDLYIISQTWDSKFSLGTLQENLTSKRFLLQGNSTDDWIQKCTKLRVSASYNFHPEQKTERVSS